VSLEAILAQIRKEGQAQVDQLIDLAECDSKSIIQQARQESAAVYDTAYQEAFKRSTGESARLLNQARFEAKCLLGRAREDFIAAVLEEVHQRLEQARNTEEYAQAMRRYLLEIISNSNGRYPMVERLRLQADPRDRLLLNSLLKDEGLVIEVDYVLECWGGMSAVTNDRKLRLVNTLEARLESAVSVLSNGLAKQFEEQTSAALKPAAITK
jgi:vacuolar-type H+-ATPase subunit E/Vma4